MDYYQADPDCFDFGFQSEIHGLPHTLRVMRLVLHLGVKHRLDQKSIIAPAFCAAVIHDMARNHDGKCLIHGKDAVSQKLPLWIESFKKWGLEDEWVDNLAEAVENHCLPHNGNESDCVKIA